jgi:hypothetical protein
MVDIKVLNVTDPDGDPVTITITRITQDEPVNTVGDGNFEPDGGGIGTSTAQVRAERTGTPKAPGNGRVYVIWFKAVDPFASNNGTCDGSVRVCVPHDQGKGKVCIDDGQKYNSVTGAAVATKPLRGGLALSTDPVQAMPVLPEAFSLDPNYPNPFNPATTIRYALPEGSEVRLVVYNLLGQQVRALVQGRQEAGYYRVTWDGRDAADRPVSSGVYLYRLEAGGVVQTRRMLLLK